MMESILAKAKKKCDQAELYTEEAHSLLARSSLDKIEACKSTSDKGFGLRVVHKGRIGHSYFNRPEDADRAIAEAVRSAKLSHKENYSLPSPTRYKSTKGFDKKIPSISEDELVDMLLESMDATAENAAPLKAEFDTMYSTMRVINTEGVDAEVKDTLFTIYCVGKKEESTGDDFFVSKKFLDRAHAVGLSAGEWAAKGKGAKPRDYEGPVTLHQDVIAAFFQASVMRNLNGELVRRGKTRWEGKIGEKITGDFTLIDDPTIDWGVGTNAFDDEGVACKKKVMINNGVLKQLYYDTRTANLAGKKSTGNGFKSGYSSLPTVGVANVILESKQRTKKKGLFVQGLMGYHNMNPISGDFSLDITLALLDETPIRGCVLTGNIFDILKEAKFCGASETREWFTSPQMVFDGKVVAK